MENSGEIRSLARYAPALPHNEVVNEIQFDGALPTDHKTTRILTVD